MYHSILPHNEVRTNVYSIPYHFISTNMNRYRVFTALRTYQYIKGLPLQRLYELHLLIYYYVLALFSPLLEILLQVLVIACIIESLTHSIGNLQVLRCTQLLISTENTIVKCINNPTTFWSHKHKQPRDPIITVNCLI